MVLLGCFGVLTWRNGWFAVSLDGEEGSGDPGMAPSGRAAEDRAALPAVPSLDDGRGESRGEAPVRSVSPAGPALPAVVDNEQVWRQLDGLDRILAPTSEADRLWMLQHLYPRERDINAADASAFEELVARGDLRTERDAIFYAANVLAARHFRVRDQRWLEYAKRSEGPFPAELALAAAVRDFDEAYQSPESGRRLIHAMARAQVFGVIDAPTLFDGFRGLRPDVSALAYARHVQHYSRQLAHSNVYYRRWGLSPIIPSPRPAPPWLGGPCPPAIPDC